MHLEDKGKYERIYTDLMINIHSEGSHGNHQAAPEPMCLPTLTQTGCEHTNQCISLVHANKLRIAPQTQTCTGMHASSSQ